MKKKLFWGGLAVIAAMVSCVKEDGSDSGSEGFVTITAVASEVSKTVVDGMTVNWEATDKIKVVLEGKSEKMFEDFDVRSIKGASARFTGDLDASIEVEDRVNAYAVYPASAVCYDDPNVNAGGTGKLSIVHNLPEIQTGMITSGMNLSSAVISVEDLRTGTADATFHNALALLYVTVPEGVLSVSFSADGLVGDAEFTMDSKDKIGAPGEPNISATGMLATRGGNAETVTVSNGGNALEVKKYAVLVYPISYTSLQVRMVATDGTEFTSSVDTQLSPSVSYEINLSKIFQVGAGAEMYMSPEGGELAIPIITTEDYDYNAEVSQDWIKFRPQSKGFHMDNVVFDVEPNEGAQREAVVTVFRNGNQFKTIKVIQKGIFMEIMVDDNGDPIRWKETFSVYSDAVSAETGQNPKVTFENEFTIGLSDDMSKGVYEVHGMFAYNDIYSGKTGGDYYADYDDGVLTVYRASAKAPSYSFTDDVHLEYDKDSRTFTVSAPIGFGTKYTNSDFPNKQGWIGGYAVAVNLEDEPSGGDAEVNPLAAAAVGEYTESGFSGYPAPGKLLISLSDDPSKGDLKVVFGFDTTVFYATVSGDENTTVITVPETDTGLWGPVSATLTFIPSAKYIYGSVKYGWGLIYSYSASK